METEYRPPANLTQSDYTIDHKHVLQPLWNSFLGLDSYDNIGNQMLLMEMYEQKLGIQPQINASPITLVTHNEYYMPNIEGLYEKTVYKLIRNKVHEATGLTITQLMDLPTYELQTIVRAIIAVKRAETEQEKKKPDKGFLNFDKMKF